MINLELEKAKNQLGIAVELIHTIQEAMTYGGQPMDTYALALSGACSYLEEIVKRIGVA